MPSTDRLETLARLGFAARGVVYVLLGWFAVQAARTGARPGDSQAALASVIDAPFGRVLLAVIALGLACYGLWRLVGAGDDSEGEGSSGKARAKRVGHALSGIAHLALAAFAVRLVWRGSSSGEAAGVGDAQAEDWTAWLLAQPFGEALVILVGIGFFAAAASQALKAWRGDFAHEFGADTRERSKVVAIGRVGYAARAVVFAFIGWFFVQAGRQSDASEAGGIAQALAEVQARPYGPGLLLVVAIGLLLFGLFSLVQARYRRIAVPLASRR